MPSDSSPPTRDRTRDQRDEATDDHLRRPDRGEPQRPEVDRPPRRGKAASRANAFRHGLTGAGVVLPGEDRDEVAARSEALAPGGADEFDEARCAGARGLLDRIAGDPSSISARLRATREGYDPSAQNARRFATPPRTNQATP